MRRVRVSVDMEHENAFAVFTLVADRLAADGDVVGLCALAACSHEAHLACEDVLGESRRETVLALRLRLVKYSSWAASVCREGATRLSLDGQVAATELSTLLRYARLSGATEIKLRNCYIGRQGMLALALAADKGILDRLLVLNVSHDFINDDSLETFAERGVRPGTFPQLRTLNLSNNNFGDRGLRAFCAALMQQRAEEAMEVAVAENPREAPQIELEVASAAAVPAAATPQSTGTSPTERPPPATAGTSAAPAASPPPATHRPPLPALTCLRIAGASDSFSDATIRALAAALTDGALPSLQQLVVPRGQEKHAALKQACRMRRVRLV